MLYYFYGVSFGQDRMIGFINSKELVLGFNESWIPHYQRERILRRKKINTLIDIYKNHKPIDSVKLNLNGKVQKGDDNDMILDGEFHIIDGQQRLCALKDSGVLDYKVPVELYINTSIEEEIRLFHQFNSAGTKLTFGELAKSYQGPMADMMRAQLRNKKTMPIPLAVNSTRMGLTLSSYVPIVLWVSRKMKTGATLESVPASKRCANFLQEEHDQDHVMMVDYAVRNLLKNHVELFGDYDPVAISYRKGFLLAWMHVLINNFLTKLGTIDFEKFKAKLPALPGLLRNAHLREMLNASTGNHALIYNSIIDHFNYKLKGGHLPSFREEARGVAAVDELNELYGEEEDDDSQEIEEPRLVF